MMAVISITIMMIMIMIVVTFPFSCSHGGSTIFGMVVVCMVPIIGRTLFMTVIMCMWVWIVFCTELLLQVLEFRTQRPNVPP